MKGTPLGLMPDNYFGGAHQVVGQVNNVLSVRAEQEVQWEHEGGNRHEPLRVDRYFNYSVSWRNESFNIYDLLLVKK